MATEIVVDTETTGLDPEEGHRIVEIAMVEIEGLNRTGNRFHCYLNPQTAMSERALEIHGLTDEFLSNKPLFGDMVDEMLEFIGESRLVIHNAEFDLKFINHELERVERAQVRADQVFDTLQFARQELPGIASHSLDALCRHFKIDNSMRIKHGALLDAELLAEVYFRLAGGGQGLFDLLEGSGKSGTILESLEAKHKPRETKLPSLLTAAEAEAHRELVKSLGDSALWNSVLLPKTGSGSTDKLE